MSQLSAFPCNVTRHVDLHATTLHIAIVCSKVGMSYTETLMSGMKTWIKLADDIFRTPQETGATMTHRTQVSECIKAENLGVSMGIP